MRQLRDSVVVITGASSGIGRVLALELDARGAKLVLAARRVDKLESLNASLGSRHLCVQMDVSRPRDCQELIEYAIEHFGRLDTLVCNAGYGLAKDVAETSHEEMEQIFRTNVFGTTDCINAAIPHLRGNELRDGYRGQIVIISSAAARRGMVSFGPYSATKASQLSIAEALRVELKRDRIAVTSVHPITTETEFFDTASLNSGKRVDIHLRSPVIQPAKIVAQKIARAMEKPRREVWPYLPARPMLSLVTLVPMLGDWVMGRMGKGRETKRRRDQETK